MPRRARATKREIAPDARYRSATVARLVSKVMQRGKKQTAESIVYGALDLLGQHVSKDPVAALEQAVRNATPLLQVKPRRVGGATYQVPVEVQPDRGLFLALTWLVSSARVRKGKAMMEKLADELTDAFQGQGTTVKKREDTHRMAEANRAFAHYRW
ncbi:MAG TPA: 30S ribosomal protein S7 [Dehalococcoidales bacterium]|nr:MAG: 30S ribosomal protein S7 [Chloroflexi bacterium RBG_16_60_22]HJX13797.1 30S ribosomal protein S7 [Dehalococcoidales bacterium]